MALFHHLTIAGVTAAAALVPVTAVADEEADAPLDESLVPSDTEQAAETEQVAETDEEPQALQRAAAADDEDEENTVELLQDEEIEPNFGTQKFRVGVQIADGSFAPEGTTTVGSEFEISFFDADGNFESTTDCVTRPSPLSNDPTASFCFASGIVPLAARSADVTDGHPILGDGDTYSLDPGATAQIRQVSAPDNLEPSTEVVTIDACLAGPGSMACPSASSPGSTRTSDVRFHNTGLLPVATNDVVTATAGQPLEIDVLANDDTVNGAPLVGVEIVSPAAAGPVEVIGEGDETRLRYSPAADFSGADSFEYAIRTANGTATATVTITVQGAATGPGDGSTGGGTDGGPAPGAGGEAAAGTGGGTVTAAANAPMSTRAGSTLPSTGGPDGFLALLAAALVAAGAALTLRARRLRRPHHGG